MAHTLFRFALAFVLAGACLSLSAQQEQTLNTIEGKEISEWQRISELEPQEALVEIQQIYWAALQEQDYAKVLNAIFFRMIRQWQVEEDQTAALIDSLKLDAVRLPQPAKSVVYSLMADVYRTHFKNNRQQISRRTRTEEVSDDIATWDISRLFEETLKCYQMSIQEEEILKQTPVNEYSEPLNYVFSKDKHKLTLPTLYDLLVFQAILAFGTELSVALPQATFVIDQPAYIAEVREFIAYPLPTIDTLSSEYQVISMFQKLLRFRLSQPDDALNRYALVTIDIERLRYVLNGRYKNGEVLYANALKEMIERLQAHEEKYYPMYMLATWYKTKAAEWRHTKNDTLRNKYWEAYHLCEQIVASSDSVLTVYAKQLQEEIKNPSAELMLNYLQYPQTPILGNVSYRNINKLYLYAYQLEEEEAYECLGQSNYLDFNIDKATLIKTQTIELPTQPDYQDYSTEIKIEGLPQGMYVVIASDIPDLSKENLKKHSGKLTSGVMFQVSSIGVAVIKGTRELRDVRTPNFTERYVHAYVADSKTGEPVKDGQIAFYQGDTDTTLYLVGTYATDQYGKVTFKQNDSKYITKFVVTQKNNRFVYDEGFSYAQYKSQPRPMAVFFTDRSIYRPGQTVFYKAICINDKQLLTNQKVTVEFQDVNRKTITTEELTTGEYGTIQGNFVIPQGMLNGQMSLICKIGDSSTGQAIRVEEYKRPTFEVVYNPLDKNYRLNDSVTVSGKANAFAGFAIDNARVAYRVVRNEQPRYKYWWLPQAPTSRQREITSGDTVTRSDGSFEIMFKALADDVRDESLIYLYAVTADITDVNGETRSASLTVKVNNNPLLIETNIPQKIVNRDSLQFNLTTTNLNGDFTPAEVVVTLVELKSPQRILHNRLWAIPDTLSLSRAEFEKSFPFDAYGDETNPEKFPVVKTSSEIKVNTANDKNFELSALKKAKAGWYRLDMKACTPDGVTLEEKAYFQLSGAPDGKNVPITRMDDWVTVVKNTCEPGENMELWVAGGSEKTYINYEILMNNGVSEQKSIVTGMTPQRIIIPVKEEYRGGGYVQLVMIQNQRVYQQSVKMDVPYTNKQLDVTFSTFRYKLQPGVQEKWTLTVKNRQGEKEMAEMVATLYDASLDAILPHSWADIRRFYPPNNINYGQWQTPINPMVRTSYYLYRDHTSADIFKPVFPSLPKYPVFSKSNLEEVTVVAFGVNRRTSAVASLVTVASQDLKAPSSSLVTALESTDAVKYFSANEPSSEQFWVRENVIPTRRNFNETAFFYPQLRTDENGDIAVVFTIPEALTRWKMLGFAHTKDLKVGNITTDLITQKNVAISAHAPRFFRENDVIEFTAKVNNIADEDLSGQALLQLYDATNMQPIDNIIQTSREQGFNVKTGESVGLQWTLVIPEGIQAITYKVTAKAGNHTDGEEKTAPVVTNSMLVTETMPFSVRGRQQKSFAFKKLQENQSTTLRNHRLTLELTSNPAWYAIQAMPYLMEYPYECSEQVFSRFYANTLASTVTNSSPRIKEIFDLWQTLPENQDALLSNLEKDQELKQVLLAETPWVMQANNETERKKRVGLLFDLNRMGGEQQRSFDKLKKMQLGDGSFPWFDGLPSNRFITQHIIAGIGHLKAMNALPNTYISQADLMVANGLRYLDNVVRSDYDALLRTSNFDPDKQHITATQLGYLYTCSFTLHQPEGKEQREAFDFFRNQAVRYWKQFNLYSQAMTALALHRYGDTATASAIVRSLKGRALRSEEMGMYWRDNTAGYFWYQAPVETQAILIEAFNEVTNDRESVEEMKIWLLRNKQTNDWKTTKATTEACYALLMTRGNLLDESQTLEVKLGGKPLADIAVEPVRPEPGTGYVKTSWSGSDIQKEMAALEARNPNRSGVAWGGLYWQYFEQLDKITSAETNLQMSKQLFLRKNTERGPELTTLNEQNKLKVGDLVTVRMELRADRDFEYVHLKDMRASCFEPVSALSGYRYQDGLWYYESIKDASINFFIAHLPKGTYVFEYNLRVTHVGNFSNGITTFQCMYAPEFSSHSEGIRVSIAD